MKHLLKLGGLTRAEILHILDVADEYKRLHRQGIDPKDLQGKGYDPRKLLAPGAEAIKATVREKIELFGSANKA